jgi:branched-chain amino acid aminotransferase
MIVSGVVDIDGTLVPAAQAKVSAFDRGFLHGDSAFEALRTYGKRPFRGREHVERLLRSCERLRIAPAHDAVALERKLSAAVDASGLPECYLRMVITRGVAPLGADFAIASQPSTLIYALELKLPDPSFYRDGIAVGLVRTQRATDGTAAAGAKASNYLSSLLALDEVRRRGCQEAVIVSAQGELLEGATSNLFVVDDDGLATPPLAGILEGITRREVLSIATQLGIVCRERRLEPADLAAAKEAFITSSIREVVPVVRADSATIGTGKPGLVTLAVLDAYRARTRQ